MAVGYNFSNNGATPTLAEQWNGASWAVIATPAAGTVLRGVSCVTATDCTAVGVGSDGTTSVPVTLVEHWDGLAWSIVPSPNPGSPAQTSDLSGVSCVSANDCVAVGVTNPGTQIQGGNLPLIERWNGSAWSIVPSPAPAASTDTILTAVSCTSASACVAVGYWSAPPQGQHTLVERWDGSTWTISPSADPHVDLPFLYGVSCSSATDCVAVGVSYDFHVEEALVEHWDGSSWTIVDSPYPPRSPGTILNGVSCTSPTSCVAAGGLQMAGGPIASLVERWDGSSWSLDNTAVPTISSDGDGIQAVSCSGATSCGAVGATFNGQATGALVEHYPGGVNPAPQLPAVSVTRVSGADRLSTAIAAADYAFGQGNSPTGAGPFVGAAVVASADSFPDGLAGTVLARAVHGPLLLSHAASLRDDVLATIKGLLGATGDVYVLGGYQALSQAVSDSITAAGYTVHRIAGADRYATAAAIADTLVARQLVAPWNTWPAPTSVIVTTGLNFPDALAAGVAAAHVNAVLLFSQDGTQAPATSKWLQAHPTLPVTIVGGPAAGTVPGATLLAGVDRYDTSVRVAERFFQPFAYIGVASGEAFPDALSGGASIAAFHGPILLTRQGSLPATVQTWLRTNRDHIAIAYVYGGTAAIADGVISAVSAATG